MFFSGKGCEERSYRERVLENRAFPLKRAAIKRPFVQRRLQTALACIWYQFSVVICEFLWFVIRQLVSGRYFPNVRFLSHVDDMIVD